MLKLPTKVDPTDYGKIVDKDLTWYSTADAVIQLASDFNQLLDYLEAKENFHYGANVKYKYIGESKVEIGGGGGSGLATGGISETKEPMFKAEDLKIGYYRVKFYNHNRLMILYWTGEQFEKFPSDKSIDDEIESRSFIELT